MTNRTPLDLEAFKVFEHDGWEQVSHSYHDSIELITQQAAKPLLDAVEAGPGVKLLDLACGTGYVSALASAQGAEVIGLDFASSMVDEASKLHPDIEFREGDAEALPFADESFDVIVCNFGILHFARPEQAIAQTYRVLSTGGRVAFTAWAPPERSPYFANFLGAVAAQGDMHVPLPEGPPIFSYGDVDECKRSLVARGYTNLTHRELPLVVRLDAEDEVLNPLYYGSVRSRGLLLAQKDEKRERIHQAATTGAKKYSHGNAIEIPIPALLTAARKQ
jgi:ubiquinone/menaquinone biosynthesis C-methylase UbiE